MALKSVLKFDCAKMLQNGQAVLLCGVGLLNLHNSKQVRQRYTDFVEWLTDSRA